MLGLYVVLDDESTYGLVDGASVVLLTSDGLDRLEETMDFKNVPRDSDNIKTYVTINELIDAYNMVHGTNI